MYANLIDEHVQRAWSAVKFSTPPLGDVKQALHNNIYQINLFSCRKSRKPSIWTLCRTAPRRAGVLIFQTLDQRRLQSGWNRKFAAHFSIPMSDVMAIGDGENDIDMLRAAGIGVAMGNASDAVKKSG